MEAESARGDAPGMGEATSDLTPSRPRVEALEVERDPYKVLRELGFYAIPFVIILVGWSLAIAIWDIKPFLLPRPIDVLNTLWTERIQLMQQAWVTLQESLSGFVLAVVVAVPVAILVTFSTIAARTIYPILVITQVIPKIAIAPLLVVWMGFGITSKILLAFLVAFFAIVVNTGTGLKSIDPKMIYLARSMGASTWDTFMHFRLPNSLPVFFAGLKLGVTLALIGAIVGEFVASGAGLGHLTVVASGSLNTELVFAAIIVMAFIGIGMYAVIEIIERLAIPWSRADRLDQMSSSQ